MHFEQWKDVRGGLSVDLTSWPVGGSVISQQGQVTIGYPTGVSWISGRAVGVYYDLGPNSRDLKAVTYSMTRGPGSPAGIQVYCRAASELAHIHSAVAPYEDSSVSPHTLASVPQAPTTFRGLFTLSGLRYVCMFLFNSGATYTTALDDVAILNSVQIYADSSWRSGNLSILRAHNIVSDLLQFAPALNQSQAAIASGTFDIPEFDSGSYRTPRDLIEAANAFENYRMKIGGADLRTLVYGPKPTTPVLEIGEWAGAEYADATISGEEIYSRVLVPFDRVEGTPAVADRTQTGTLVGRRGYARTKRLDISATLTQAVADRFGDLWLTEHRTAPFASRVTTSGEEAARVPYGGARVPAHELLLYSQEQIRLANRIDPDTGAWGRDGVIQGVVYRHDDRSAELAIGDRRDSFERILSRYAVLASQIPT
jgi:hypothetical protein